MFRDIIDEFCNRYKYVGSMGYDKETDEYRIIISKGDDNAGAFLTKDEMDTLNNDRLKEILNMLHMGFENNFK